MNEEFILAVGAALFGAILGSFLNALSFRFGTGLSIANGRSKCMRCGHALAALDLVPVFSYIFLRGRCRYCGTPISVQYPLVEAVAAVVSLELYLVEPSIAAYAFALAVSLVLLFVAVYDLRHSIIPWSASLLLVAAAVGYLLFEISAAGMPPLWDLLAGPLLALPLFLLWLVSRGRWMGLGDSVLELSLGAFLGLTAGLTAFFLAFWIGAAVGIILIVAQRGVTIKSEVPLAPFLIAGVALVYFLHVDFFQTLPLLW